MPCLLELLVRHVAVAAGFLEALNPLVWVGRGRVAPFPGLVEDIGEEELLSVGAHLGGVTSNVQVLPGVHGAITSIGMCPNTLSRWTNLLSLSLRVRTDLNEYGLKGGSSRYRVAASASRFSMNHTACMVQTSALGCELKVATRGHHRDTSAGSDAHQRSFTMPGDRPQ